MTDSELRAYYKEIKNRLICSAHVKRRFLSLLRNEITGYLSEHPEAEIDEIALVFGSPRQIAESAAEELSPEELRSKTDLKKIVSAVLITALTIYAVFVCASLIDVHTEAHGYEENGIVIIEPENGG